MVGKRLTLVVLGASLWLVAVALPAAADTFDLPLRTGWNLVSLPLQPEETAISSVLAGIAGSFRSVWTLDEGRWRIHRPSAWRPGSLTTMEAGRGYLILMGSPATLTVRGTPPPTTVALRRGWNMVGYNRPLPLAARTALGGLGSRLRLARGKEGGSWQVYSPVDPTGSSLVEMAPGRGYLLRMREAADWQQDPLPGPEGVAEVVDAVTTPSAAGRATSYGGGITSVLAHADALFPEVETLVAAGSAVQEQILPRFAGNPSPDGDAGLALLALVLARVGDRSAVAALIDFLEANLDSRLSLSLDSATHALKILTGQEGVRHELPVYPAPEVFEAVDQARLWLLDHPAGREGGFAAFPAQSDARGAAVEACRLRFTLVDPAGAEHTWHDPDLHRLQPVSFELKNYRSTAAPVVQGQINAIMAGGGRFVDGPEGDQAQTGRRGICGGYALREALRESPANRETLPAGGWMLDPDEVYQRLRGGGLIEEAPAGVIQPGYLVFWFQDAGRTRAGHAAVVESHDPYLNRTRVRNKDETSGVFVAEIDSRYYNDSSLFPSDYPRHFGTPVIFRFVGGRVPRFKVDTSLWSFQRPGAGETYCKNAILTVENYDLATSVLVSAEGTGISDLGGTPLPFRMAFNRADAPGSRKEVGLVLPLGEKTIQAAGKDVPAADALAGLGKTLTAKSAAVTPREANLFDPLRLTLDLAPENPVITGFSPTTVHAGDILTVTGFGFSPNPADQTVRFTYYHDTVPLTASPTQLTVRVPVLAPGAYDVGVYVTGKMSAHMDGLTFLRDCTLGEITWVYHPGVMVPVTSHGPDFAVGYSNPDTGYFWNIEGHLSVPETVTYGLANQQWTTQLTVAHSTSLTDRDFSVAGIQDYWEDYPEVVPSPGLTSYGMSLKLDFTTDVTSPGYYGTLTVTGIPKFRDGTTTRTIPHTEAFPETTTFIWTIEGGAPIFWVEAGARYDCR